jgi:catechol 2,3-dioxygenase-like lactoylglutathione lyase family enzyme
MTMFDGLPKVAEADPELPGTLELGVFSISLAVADLERSRDFYQALGFEVTGGGLEQRYLILKNGESTLGLFHGMFDRNILTFNPGLTARMERLEQFTDVREVRHALDAAGLEFSLSAEGDAGAGSITLVDPDGNPVLIDQFF